MNVSRSSIARAIARQNQSLDAICISCAIRLARQSRYASTTTTTKTASPQPHNAASRSPPRPNLSNPSSNSGPIKTYAVKTGVVLSRPPIITRTLTPFEKSFYLYQRRLNERLALPFTRYFYYKKGTPAEEEWKRRARARKSAARDIGQYSAYGDEGWADEVLVGDTTREPERQVLALINDAEGRSLEGEELPDVVRKGEDAVDAKRRKESAEVVVVDRPNPRVTGADTLGQRATLERMLDRTVYLMVKNGRGLWRFPEDVIRGREGLHDAAERIIVQAGGVNMNTWVVGNAPVGNYVYDYPKAIQRLLGPATTSSIPETPDGTRGESPTEHERSEQVTTTEAETTELGEKVFFMKARIMSGRPDMSKNTFGDAEYCWLAKEEIEKVVTTKYWSSIRNVLAER